MSDHGTRTCYVNGCRCQPCTQANTDYENRRTRAIAYGRWHPFRPAGITVQRIDWLRREGMGLRTIADEAGTSRSVLQKIIRGETKQVRVETQMAVLAIEPTLDKLRPSALVDAAGTWRLVRRLVGVGFTKAEIGRWVTRNPDAKALQLGGEKVSARAAMAVEDLHRRWEAGEIVPASARRPVLVRVEPSGPGCEECGGETLAGGRWCLPCFQARARRAS